MTRAIIIAGLLFSSAVFASSDNAEGRSRVRKAITCDSTLLASLGPSQVNMIERLNSLFDKYEIASMTMPDVMRSNMKSSVAAVHAEILWLAKQITQSSNARSASEVDMMLTRLETEVEVAMRAPSMKADTAIPNKAKMETRGFGEDWSDLDRSPRRQQEQRHQDRVRPLNEQPVSNDPNPFDSGVGPALGWPPRLKP